MADSKITKLADELEGLEDEVTENHFHLPKGTTLEADRSGKLKAISVPDDDRETPTDPPRIQMSSEPPPKLSPLAIAWLFAKRMPPWGLVAVAIAGIVAYVLLRR